MHSIEKIIWIGKKAVEAVEAVEAVKAFIASNASKPFIAFS